MTVSRHITEMITERLDARRIVVLYDPDRVFRGLFEALDIEALIRVDAGASVLRARREADRAFRTLLDPESLEPPGPKLLIYVPWERGKEEETRREDPFEAFALVGAAFGGEGHERLPSLARKVLTGRDAEVDRLFSEGTPTLEQLDAMAAGTRYPLLLQLLGSDVPAAVARRLLCRRQELHPIAAEVPGLLPELRRLLNEEYGLVGAADVTLDGLASELTTWVLWSEFVFDLPRAVPAALAQVPRAEARHRRPIYGLCQELRDSSEDREVYREVAREVERRLGLSRLGDETDAFGERDTFPFEDRAALLRAQKLALEGNMDDAWALVKKRRGSVWRAVPERDLLWRLLERCLDLLGAGRAWADRAVGAGRPPADHIRAYCCEEDGLWRVDQRQRLVEQAAAQLLDRESLAPLLGFVRRRYRDWLDAAQGAFLEAVARSGWPAEGYPRQAQAWARHGGGAVRDGRKVAWFMVDALRYEMGRDLLGAPAADRRPATGLMSMGKATCEPACGVIPAATPFGMAALLPGAESGLGCSERDGALVPTLGGRPVLTVDDRRDVFRAALGDRVASIRLGRLLTASTAELRDEVGAADVLCVFSTEIDDFGEHTDPLVARRYIGEVVADLRAAADRLVQLGFERLVFAADHGYIQLPEVLPGDRVPEPAGRWSLRKRRALLGSLAGRADGAVVLPAISVGIEGPVDQICVPRGVKVFRAGSPYFHEGVSLQESVVPLVVLDATPRRPTAEGEAHVQLTYRSAQITAKVFTVQVRYSSLTRPTLPVRIQVFAPGTGTVVGEAADCEARDPETGLIVLSAGARVQVPLILSPDFSGAAVEVRALDPGTQRAYDTLALRNATLD